MSKLLDAVLPIMLAVCLLVPAAAASATSIIAPELLTNSRDLAHSADTDTPRQVQFDNVLGAVPLAFGQTIEGSLCACDQRDPVEPRCYSDAYVFSGTAGQTISIAMNSSEFQPYLTLYKKENSTDMTMLIQNGRFTSILPATAVIGRYVLPQTGMYMIIASSTIFDAVGSYSITVNQPSESTPFDPQI